MVSLIRRCSGTCTYGWVVVFASFLALFAMYGVQYTYGVFQQQYQDIYRGRATTTGLAFIGSVSFAALGLFGLFTGRLGDWLGYRVTMSIGTLLMCLALLLASWASEVWHLYLTQGLMFGLGTSFAFYPVVSAPARWFDRRRGFVTGIAMSGSGLGGMALAPITRKLIDVVGVAWTLRCLAAVAEQAIDVQDVDATTVSAPVGSRQWLWTRIKHPAFLGLWITNIFGSLGYLVPFYYIPSYAASVGYSKTDGAMLVGIMNGASALGRIGLGWAADYVGRINMYVGSVAAGGLVCLAIWLPSTGMAPLVVFSLLYGMFMGGFAALTPVVITVVFGMDGLSTIIGMIFASSGVSNLIGSPIAGAILDATKEQHGYMLLILYAGIMVLCGAIMAALLVRQKMTRHWLVRI
ncbi:major facilitator superfamily domain-containing protein [Syncephalis pseudoplumigaleata]|uniref:Major facilitator superfamily domain-containing protein n=1 Tax=Syncephalis pseudoplumigaleata TaxID=1712513 RepID=A0A4P9YSA0_9FUNG|nr:major facilitator superfamily domain-containing protein [Syncephalis pseudoplumigaleata]|eukprot:RKP22803.1 major facilitator superfamily domain-containing protein [Syncephalis pseudoplumigaleata]